MGAWGSGIFQNDLTQDELCEVADGIEAALGQLGDPSPETGAQLAAGIALLMQFSPYSLDPDGPSRERILAAITTHRSAIDSPSAELSAALDAIVAGERPDYQLMKFPAAIETALHGPQQSEFPVQKTWARAPEGVFDHPAARAFLRGVADSCAGKAEQLFLESEEWVLGDLCREGFGMGSFGLLLVLDPIDLDVARVKRWRAAWEAGKGEPHPSEADFILEYEACVAKAFDALMAKCAPNDS